jgi:hypothetical protein
MRARCPPDSGPRCFHHPPWVNSLTAQVQSPPHVETKVLLSETGPTCPSPLSILPGRPTSR